MPGWNFAEMWEVAAEQIPDAPSLTQGGTRLSWAEVDRRADGVAAWLLDLGVGEQDKVAQYLYNCPEYLESMFAAYKVGLVPVNTNYRYGDEELAYLWDNADAVAVVFHASFTERVAALRKRMTKVRGWLWVDDGSGPCPDWATPYDEPASSHPGRQRAPWGRDGDHLYMLYTGGTTGMPKGVMWRQDDLIMMVATQLGTDLPEEPDYDLVRSMRTSPGSVALPACPLMHGTAALVAQNTLTQGGSVVLLAGRSYDPVELLDTIEAEKVNVVVVVGDAFAKPMLRALENEPGRWDLSSVVAMTSSGVMWSEETKQGLLRHHDKMVLVDAFSSSEALGMGMSVSGGGQTAETARFQLGANAVVVTDDGRFAEPGSGEIGMVGVGGRVPLGYYKDEEKTAKTFRIIDGRRYSIPGDYATVEADGSITLLGRGSVCINTGGEKVFPEEVEEVLKSCPGVRDAVVVGVPDEKWGEAVTALVEVDASSPVSEIDLVGRVKEHLAGFKAPKWVLFVDTIGRAPNGKVDYKRCRAEALERIGARR
ncbi:MAG TPA: AMP-binding protein [Acidimicrobiales bacterium]|nr:AMP-binding protein [Acidimicrobiales bacterium]